MACPIYSQSKLLDGFLVTERGDTLFGKLQVEDRVSSPTFVRYTGDKGLDVRYYPGDLRSFEIPGYCSYVSLEAYMDDRPEVGYNLSYFDKERIKIARVFLKKLVQGNRLNLYYYKDHKEHFFYQHSDAEPTYELQYSAVFIRGDKMDVGYIDEYYKDVLKRIASKYDLPFLEAETNAAGYTAPPLISIVKKINTLRSALSYDATAEIGLIPRISPGYFTIASGWNTLRQERSPGNLVRFHFPTDVSFSLTYGRILGLNFFRNKMVMKGELMGYLGGYKLFTMDSIGRRDAINLDIGATFVDLSGTILASYYPLPDLDHRPSISLGLQAIVSFSRFTSYTETNAENLGDKEALVTPMRLAPMIKLGAVITKEFELFLAKVFHPRSLFTNGTWFRSQPFIIGLNIGEFR